ncbi:MAG TPA: excinuclease ABC subunit A, partial [Bacteroidia bacterium]|nr:excinuclease ABC subunit A [Bacteroidia bacterium]
MAANNNILIKGAREHNLKNIDVEIARNKMTVVTGVSGSGKSSLVFDTLYAEGQRRYVESLSAYARQFMDKMNKPEVDYIRGISPAIAIEQKVNTRNPRSTVATSTEIYDYLKLLFTKIGKTISPVSGDIVKRHTVEDVVNFVVGLENESTVLVLSRINTTRKLDEELKILLQKGFARILVKDEIHKIEELAENKAALKKVKPADCFLVIDRILIDKEDDELFSRAADSVQTAFLEGHQECFVKVTNPAGKEHTLQFSSRFEADGIIFEQPSTDFFSFNNPYGACKTCEGFGSVIGIDEDLVVPDKSLSVYEGAVAAWRGETMSEWKEDFIRKSIHFDFPIHRSYFDLNEKEKALLWEGARGLDGINDFFKYLEEKIYKIQYRVMLSKYRGKTTCPDCRGTRLRKDATYVKLINENNPEEKLSITDIVLMPVSRASEYFNNLKLNNTDAKIADRILKEITNRLTFMLEVGLGYLTLNRLSNTLSGGESQRINLATSLGSSLVGSMYILDEPSIGLHSRDTENLVRVLKSLRDLGNTVVIVEHDEDVMIAADELVDIGPYAGRNGGE